MKPKPTYFNNVTTWRWYHYVLVAVEVLTVLPVLFHLGVFGYNTYQWDKASNNNKPPSLAQTQTQTQEEQVINQESKDQESKDQESKDQESISPVKPRSVAAEKKSSKEKDNLAKVLNQKEPDDLKAYFDFAHDNRTSILNKEGKLLISEILKDNLSENLTKFACADYSSAVKLLESRWGHLLTPDQKTRIFNKHNQLIEWMQLYRAGQREGVPLWIGFYNFSSLKLQPLEADVKEPSTVTTKSSIQSSTAIIIPQVNPIDVYADLSDKETPSTYIAYVEAVAKISSEKLPQEKSLEREKITRNLFIATLNSLQAAKLFFQNKLEELFKSYFVETRLKNIFQKHRKYFLDQEGAEKNKEEEKEAPYIKSHHALLEELRETNIEHAINTFSVLANPGWQHTSKDNDGLKLFFDYLSIQSNNDNKITALIIGETQFDNVKHIDYVRSALEKTMINDVTMAKYILSQPKSKELFRDTDIIANVLQAHYQTLVLQTDETLSTFKKLHIGDIAKFSKSHQAIFIGWKKPTELPDKKDEEDIESDPDYLLLNKSHAITFLLTKISQISSSSSSLSQPNEIIKLILNSYREIFLDQSSKDSKISLIQDRLSTQIKDINTENLHYLKTEASNLKNYTDMDYYLQLALDYRKDINFLKEIKEQRFKETFKINLQKIAREHLDFACAILDSSLQSYLKEETQAIIDQYPIFKNNQHIDNEVILRIRA